MCKLRICLLPGFCRLKTYDFLSIKKIVNRIINCFVKVNELNFCDSLSINKVVNMLFQIKFFLLQLGSHYRCYHSLIIILKILV